MYRFQKPRRLLQSWVIQCTTYVFCVSERVSQQLGMTQFGVAACQRLLSYPDTQTYNNSL